MFKNALWENPVGWAQRLVGTKSRFGTIIAIHIFVGVYRCYKLGFGLDWVILFATIFPIYYLYAMKKLLEGFKKFNSNKP